MSLRKALLFVTATMLFSTTAEARERDWAIGGFGLVGFADARDLKQRPVSTGPVRLYTDTAGVNGGAGAWLSYDLQSATNIPLSLELASTWRYRHDFNVVYTAGGSYGLKLNTMTVDTMMSALYHISTGTRFTPYIGGGVGVAYLNSENLHLPGTGTTDLGNSSDWNFAWQAQAGVNYSLSPRWDLRLDYRYIDLGTVQSLVEPLATTSFEADLTSHDFRIGALWRF